MATQNQESSHTRPVMEAAAFAQSCPMFDRPVKRLRADQPPTPPLSIEDASTVSTLDKAVHVLSTEATALSHVTRLYSTDPVARDGLARAIDTVVKVNEMGGKLIICGVGKSGLVGMKITATMKSLGLACSFLHAAEAVHGDLGDVRANDALMFITYSGSTSELLTVLPHIPHDIPIMLLTKHTSESSCIMLEGRHDGILLPAPIHEEEITSFGVNAPTSSTIVSMAVGDMLSLAAADIMHDSRKLAVFQKNHPGGTIGVDAKKKSG